MGLPVRTPPARPAWAPAPPETPIRVGQLEVRLAQSGVEVAAAQALRYRIFYDEMGAQPTRAMLASRRDIDAHDNVCDHLLVIDHDAGVRGQVVGTYRLLRQSVAQAHGGFYSAGEYDLTPLLAQAPASGQLLELGRSCVAPAHRIGHLFGCASLHGTDPAAHAAELSYLYHHHLAPPELRARTLPAHFVEMDRLPAERIDARATARTLPPLLKGYLRVGAMVGDGAFIDRQFNTVDVFVVMPVAQITRRYAGRFDLGADTTAA